MRNNMPITNNEYVLTDRDTIVSKTDLQGNITYINQDFLRISGFTEDELIGAPQNIVRHPDMPPEAFADLWHTLKAGKAWNGMVKNRCKNGDHYWVDATAAPLIENRKIVGFTSIRVKASRDKIKAAESAYRAIKNGDRSLYVHEGAAMTRSMWRNINFVARMTISAKIYAFITLLVLLFGATGFSAFMDTSSQGYSTLGISAAVLGVIFSVAIGMLLFQDIVAPLQRATSDIEQMSAGDLSGVIFSEGTNEVAKMTQALRVFQTNVKLLIGQIRESTGQVSVGANEIASGNSDLSARTESQASSLEETASSMEELTSTVKHNADNAKEANQLVLNTSSIAMKGGHAVQEVVATMGAIRESSRKISDIISVIDGIAFQTNILALNAAVEAARAGEQGRGFAVVASEVRNLAQRSATAAKEIKTLINDSVLKVEAGGKLVDEAGRTMSEIVGGVKRAADIMSEITSASQEQSAGIEQVNQAVTQMDEMTQQNAALVEQAAAASESMKKQAEALTDLVDSFRLVPSAGGGQPRLRAA